VIYTDGARKGNPGPGGWGALLSSGSGTEKEMREMETTNNRMEMTVIEAPGPEKTRNVTPYLLDSQSTQGYH
jgi:ribonuclease HI